MQRRQGNESYRKSEAMRNDLSTLSDLCVNPLINKRTVAIC